MKFFAPIKLYAKIKTASAFARFATVQFKSLWSIVGLIVRNILIFIGRKALAASINFAINFSISAIVQVPMKLVSAISSLGGFIGTVLDVGFDEK